MRYPLEATPNEIARIQMQEDSFKFQYLITYVLKLHVSKECKLPLTATEMTQSYVHGSEHRFNWVAEKVFKHQIELNFKAENKYYDVTDIEITSITRL